MIEFEDEDYYTGAPLNLETVRRAEETLGVRLPRAYVETLLVRNGGIPKRRCVPTSFATSWAPDHFEIRALLGIGGDWGIDTLATQEGGGILAEWGYPDIGVVICDLPSGGHDTVMLDYSDCGPDGEPSVAYVDEDRVPRRAAASFDDFVNRLVECDGLAG
ncbi:SMI1/KNR4 family protein [Asanoa sp. WMMD1127]|uniref:SMI1/KNR4 family protein n=1 Tax=Asanoa sp. WMMD1127 TaxID=3016107 RepID=UPI002417135D|nr:SMI1/KNR4 family protein [Asanoa sp. WMMD1127]MDG4824996.1 SMI1/KNR4 family protein [Asanoa sp. WMMD1127]